MIGGETTPRRVYISLSGGALAVGDGRERRPSGRDGQCDRAESHGYREKKGGIQCVLSWILC